MAYLRRGSGDTGTTESLAASTPPAPAASYVQNPIPSTTGVLVGNGSGGVDSVSDGLSGTYTFDATVSGSVTSLTFTNGLLTAVTTLP